MVSWRKKWETSFDLTVFIKLENIECCIECNLEWISLSKLRFSILSMLKFEFATMEKSVLRHDLWLCIFWEQNFVICD